MPRHHAAATAIALRAKFLEQSCGVVASFGPTPLQIFFKALNLSGASPGRLALGKCPGTNPAPHGSAVQVQCLTDLFLRVALTIPLYHFFVAL